MNWFKGRFKYAFQGLFYAFTCDRSIRLQGIFGLIVIVFGFIFHCSIEEWMMLISAIGFVWFSEIMNSCIERCVDYISLEHNEQAKHIKIWLLVLYLLSVCLRLVLGFMYFCPNYFKWEVKWKIINQDLSQLLEDPTLENQHC